MLYNFGEFYVGVGSGPAACWYLQSWLENYLVVRASQLNVRRVEGAVDPGVQQQPPCVSNGEALPCDDEILSGKRCDVM